MGRDDETVSGVGAPSHDDERIRDATRQPVEISEALGRTADAARYRAMLDGGRSTSRASE